MKRYLLDAFLYIIIPMTLIAFVWENSIRSIPNDYAYKSEWLSKNSQNIEVLYLGPSTIMYGIDPTLSKWKGFNASHVSQPLSYDHFIFNKYIDQMKSLKFVVLGMEYWSLYGSLKEGAEWWRVKYYTIHYGSPYHENKFKYKYELCIHNYKSLGIAAKGFMRLLGLGNVSHVIVNELGYGTNYTTDNKSADWDNGAKEASRFSTLILESKATNNITTMNKEYIKDICAKCKEKGIKVILLSTPLYKTFNDNMDGRIIAERDDYSQSITSSFDNVAFLNLSENELFKAEDYYDGNHLDEHGAKKLTLIVDSIITSINNQQNNVMMSKVITK